jgi:hypothetical protein
MGCIHSKPNTTDLQTVALQQTMALQQKEREICFLRASLYSASISNHAFACTLVSISKDHNRYEYQGISELHVTDSVFDWSILPCFFQLVTLHIHVPPSNYLETLLGKNFLSIPLHSVSVRVVYFYSSIKDLDEFSFLKTCFPNLEKIVVCPHDFSTKLINYLDARQHPIKLEIMPPSS